MRQSLRVRYVIAYDVTDDRKRTKLAKFLLDYGDRMQKSVFEADLEPDEVKEILKKVANWIDKEDSLRIYPVCQACLSRVKTIGRKGPILDEDLVIV